VGQPGEPTTPKASNLTSDGISSLLNSEFANEDTADKPGQETPPDKKADDNSNPAKADEAAAEQADTTADKKTAEEPKLDGEGEGDELPPEMQTALEEWEAKGGPLPDSVQRVVNKRIGRLTGEKEAAAKRAETAEAALKAAQAEAEKLRNDPSRPAQPNPHGIPNETELARTEKAAKTFLDEAEAYLDQTATPQEQERIERFMQSNGLDGTTLKRRVREVNAYLRDELPQQRATVQQFRAQETTFNAQAERDFPWLKDTAAPEHQVVNEMLKLMPDLPKRLPNHKLVLGIYLLGYKAYEAQLAATKTGTAKPAAAKNPPPKAPAGTGATHAATVKPKSSDAASERFSKAPSRENAVSLARAALMEA